MSARRGRGYDIQKRLVARDVADYERETRAERALLAAARQGRPRPHRHRWKLRTGTWCCDGCTEQRPGDRPPGPG